MTPHLVKEVYQKQTERTCEVLNLGIKKLLLDYIPPIAAVNHYWNIQKQIASKEEYEELQNLPMSELNNVLKSEKY